jgi:hypothetical protein
MKSNKSCPWCKCNDVRVLSEKTTPEIKGLLPGYQVECTNCAARGPSGYVDAANALAAWEERTWEERPESVNPDT